MFEESRTRGEIEKRNSRGMAYRGGINPLLFYSERKVVKSTIKSNKKCVHNAKYRYVDKMDVQSCLRAAMVTFRSDRRRKPVGRCFGNKVEGGGDPS